MKRDLIFFGKILLITLAPGAILMLFLGLAEGAPARDWRFAWAFLALAGYLILFGGVVIGLRYLAHKMASWIRK